MNCPTSQITQPTIRTAEREINRRNRRKDVTEIKKANRKVSLQFLGLQ
jgi:hypothetical protein